MKVPALLEPLVSRFAREPRFAGDAALERLEREQFERLEFQRRANLLRILLPILGILVIVALPAAVYTDVQGTYGVLTIFHATSSTLQVFVVLVGIIASFVALRRGNINVATLALFGGVSGLVLLLLLNDTLFSGPLKLGIVPEFALFLVPIVLASVLGGPVLIILTTVCTTLLTFSLLTFTSHDSSFLAFQHTNAGGYVLYTVPIALQIVTGALIYGSLNGARRAQLQLSTVRVAFEREKELDGLKNQFIVNINHELRTPLMALQGYMVLAREFGHAGEPEQQEQMFDLGIETMQHVNGLVESILDIRRLETDVSTLRMVALDVREALLQATGMIDPHIIGGDRALHLQLSPNLRVLADAERLRQVLINLIVNACKYSPEGSSIEITSIELPGAPADRQKPARSSMAQITIRDHGLGIPPDQIGLLFQRFVRLERDIASRVPGTGLGLAICRAYVEAMGGTIWVESSGVVGEGSAFCFTLPVEIAA